MAEPQTITPFLWFNGNAEEAVDFYVSVFPSASKTGVSGPEGKPVTISFQLEGLAFTALNGGPQFTFSESISFVVRCKDQAEIDRYWTMLTANGGCTSACGWLKDKFGLSWQIVPENIAELLRHPDARKAMMSMTKLVIAGLEAAAREPLTSPSAKMKHGRVAGKT